MSIYSMADYASADNVSDSTARLAFIGNVHRLLALGYARLDAPKYCNADENLLTQDFVAALRQVTQDMECPRWTSYFSIHEKQKQNDENLQGNSRLELDIVFERTQRGVHPHFVIEAKRLGPSHPIKTYLGPDGLGAFISCEYAEEHNDAGMLGYIQSETLDFWSNSLGHEFDTSKDEYCIDINGTWEHHAFPDGPARTYRSRHIRKNGHRPITIYHTLLDFKAQLEDEKAIAK
jgi:hypothetical protein